MTKQEKFNRIKSALENKENKAQHLEALRNKVDLFIKENKDSNLSKVLNKKMIELEKKFNF